MNKPNRKSPFSSARAYSKQTAIFVGLAMFMMVLIHVFILRSFDGFNKVETAQPNIPIVKAALKPKAELGLNLEIEPYIYPLFAEYYPYDDSAEDEAKVAMPSIEPAVKKKYRYSLSNPNAKKARIAIMIDDMGMNRTQSRAVVEMDSVPLTLAFLPYAPDLASLTKPAQAAGHELMIHMPMEPVSSKVPLGPIALKDNMNADEIKAMLDKAYASFDGYTGLNNHMGSRVTQNKAVMDVVMDSLDKRGLFYVDSKTISTSIAAKAAREQGLAHAERDIFLDHEETLEFARGALKRLEKVALEKGHSIAIGHPKVNTIAALKEWLPTLEARGFEIVPVSELLMQRSGGSVVVAKATLPKKVKPKVKAVPKAKKTRSVVAPKFILDAPTSIEDIVNIEPAAGNDALVSDNVEIYELPAVGAEALLSAPIGLSDDDAAAGISSGLYSLSE